MDDLIPPARFEAHRRRLTELARLWLGNQAEAEDAVQDAYLRSRGGLPQSAGGAEAWLVTVVRHLCIDRLRRRQLEQRAAAASVASLEHAPSAEQLAARSSEARAVLARLARCLRPEDAAALLLHTVFDFSHAELARLAGHGEAASRQRLHRALRRLRHADDRSHGKGVDDETAQLLLGLCWRALRTASPVPLLALVGRPQVSASAAWAASPARGTPSPAAPRTRTRLLHLDGRFALGLELDGVALCTLPLGPLAPRDREPAAIE